MQRPVLVHAISWQQPAGRRRRPDLGLLAVPVAAVVIAVLALIWLRGGLPLPEGLRQASPPAAHGLTVVDGSTIRINGSLTRLVGFTTPGTQKPACDAERRLGEAATARLRELVAHGKADFAILHCACPPGTEGTLACNEGRACGTLSVDGRDVGATLVAEGLAVPFVCRGTGCPPTPRPWCG